MPSYSTHRLWLALTISITVSVTAVLTSCGSAPPEVVAINVDNSVPISDSTTTLDQSTSTGPGNSVVVETTTTQSLGTSSTPSQPVPTQPGAAQPVLTSPAVTQPIVIPPIATEPPTTPPTVAPPETIPAPSDPVGLRIETEHGDGYNRDLFADWYDADSNGCNTRKEVLIAESLDPVQIGSKCSISGGRWFSIYDNVETTDSSSFDIDHMVPLKEAWDSGAWNWNADQRKHYANDLDQPFFLIAVTASSNRSKSDRDPAEWMPTNSNYRCEYVRIWIEIKRAWDLSVDPAEHDFLAQTLAAC